MRFTGKIKTWNAERGFGFIAPIQGGQDIFVHISELPRGHVPAPDELLAFDIATKAQGKKKAVRVTPELAPVRAPLLPQTPSTRGVPFVYVLLVLVLLGAGGWLGYGKSIKTEVTRQVPAVPEQSPSPSFPSTPPPASPVATRFEAPPIVQSFSCDGRQYCSQMTSCAEATFFLRNCPEVKMDGDNDGIPCEEQFCR